jgi:hypothetical protein
MYNNKNIYIHVYISRDLVPVLYILGISTLEIDKTHHELDGTYENHKLKYHR